MNKDNTNVKLFLYSLGFSTDQSLALAKLVGKEPKDITMGLIENAADVNKEGPKGWVEGIRKTVIDKGFQTEVIDLKNWLYDRAGLATKLASKDVIWVGGGNTYYLRWLLKETGADNIIIDLVKNGKVYSGWSAGAGVAGPTLQFLETMDDPKEAPEVILGGLNLTDTVVVCHIDNEFFKERILKWGEKIRNSGYKTVELTDSQALVIDGNMQTLL